MEPINEKTDDDFEYDYYLQEDDSYDYNENEITSILSCLVTKNIIEDIRKMDNSFYMIQLKSENPCLRALTPPVTLMEHYKIYFNHLRYQLKDDFYSTLSACKEMNSASTLMGLKDLNNIFHKLCIEYDIENPQDLTSQIKKFLSTDCIDELIENIQKSDKAATGYIFTPIQTEYFFWFVSEMKINYALDKYSISICFHFPNDYSLIEDCAGKHFNCLKKNLLDKFSQKNKILSDISYTKSKWDNIRMLKSRCYGVICTEECKLLLQGLPLIHVVPKGEKQIRKKHCLIVADRLNNPDIYLNEKLNAVNNINNYLDSTKQKDYFNTFYDKVLTCLIKQNSLYNKIRERKYQIFLNKKSDYLSFQDYVLLFYEMIQQILNPPEYEIELGEIFHVIGCSLAGLEFVDTEKLEKITIILHKLFSSMDIFLRMGEDSPRSQVIESFHKLISEDEDCSIFAFTQNSFRWAFVNFSKIVRLQILINDSKLIEFEKVQYKKDERIPNLKDQEDILKITDDDEKHPEEPIAQKEEVVKENILPNDDSSVVDPLVQKLIEEKLSNERAKIEKQMKELMKEEMKELMKEEMKQLKKQMKNEMKQFEAKLNLRYEGKIKSYDAKLKKLEIEKQSLLSYYNNSVFRENLKLFKLIIEERFALPQGKIQKFLDDLSKTTNLQFKQFETKLNLQQFKNLGEFFKKFFKFYSQCNQVIHSPNIEEYKTVSYFIHAFQRNYGLFQNPDYEISEAKKILMAINGDKDSIDYSPLQEHYLKEGI